MPLPPIGSDERGLIDAIFAKPDDNDLRRIYADWLAERGHPERARIIWYQVPESGMELSDNEYRIASLINKLPASELSLPLRTDHTADSENISYVIECPFTRGMQTKLLIHPNRDDLQPIPASAAAVIAQLLRDNPHVTELEIINAGTAFFTQLAREKAISQLSRLEIQFKNNEIPDGDRSHRDHSLEPHANPVALLSSPNLGNLKELQLFVHDYTIPGSTVPLLAWLGDEQATSHLSQLKDLRIFADAAADNAIAANPHWKCMESLFLSLPGPINQIVSNLDNSEAGKTLKHLELHYLSDDSLTFHPFTRAGARHGGFKKLESLTLSGVKFTKGFIDKIADGIRNHGFPELKHVFIDDADMHFAKEERGIPPQSFEKLEDALSANRERIAGRNRAGGG